MGGYRRYQGERKKVDLLNDHSHRLESWDTLDRSLKAQHSLKSFLEREVECDQGKSQSRKGDCGYRPRQEV